MYFAVKTRGDEGTFGTLVAVVEAESQSMVTTFYPNTRFDVVGINIKKLSNADAEEVVVARESIKEAQEVIAERQKYIEIMRNRLHNIGAKDA